MLLSLPVCVPHDVLQGPVATRQEGPEHAPHSRLGRLEKAFKQTELHLRDNSDICAISTCGRVNSKQVWQSKFS